MWEEATGDQPVGKPSVPRCWRNGWHITDPYLFTGWEPAAGTVGLVVFMGNWYSPHVALWACVCRGEKEGERSGDSHTAGMSSYLDEPVFTSPSAAAALCWAWRPGDGSHEPRRSPFAAPPSGVRNRVRSLGGAEGLCEAGYLNASACVREIKVRKSYGISFVCILEERER